MSKIPNTIFHDLISNNINNLFLFHHVGFVINDLSTSISWFKETLPVESTTIPFNDIFQKVDVCFLNFKNFKLELIEPVDDLSPVKKFLEKGGGLHHIAFETTNFECGLNFLKEKQFRPLQKTITKGFEGRDIMFLHNIVSDSNFVIELIGKPS